MSSIVTTILLDLVITPQSLSIREIVKSLSIHVERLKNQKRSEGSVNTYSILRKQEDENSVCKHACKSCFENNFQEKETELKIITNIKILAERIDLEREQVMKKRNQVVTYNARK